MKNVTISMDEALMRRAKVAAAQQGLSLSKFVGKLVERSLPTASARAADKNNAQHQAIMRILEGPAWDVTENGRMPTAEERNARR